MRRGTNLVAALLLAAPAAQAQELKTFSTKAVVLADTKTQVGRIIMLEPDCEVIPLTVRITKQPKNGKLELEEGDTFPHYAKDNPRAQCNTRRILRCFCGVLHAEGWVHRL